MRDALGRGADGATMDTLESLSDALETTGDIQSIVRTMKALSSVSIRQYEHAEAAMADYARTVELGLMAVLRQRRQAGLPLPGADSGTGREALIVIGSDRGLCGGYNDKITRFALSRMDDRPMVLGVIGARVAARLEADGRRADAVHPPAGLGRGIVAAGPDHDRRDRPLERVEGVGQVWLVHNRREGRTTAKPQAHRLLPLPDSYLRKLSRPTGRGGRCRFSGWIPTG
jgi:F-type H+-transporting ATPase subunit gamma